MLALDRNPRYVLHGLDMSRCNTIVPFKTHCSYGTILFDHLAAYGAGLAGGQVTVVAVGQVNANFPWCPFYILNSPDTGIVEGSCPLGANSLIGSDTISPMNL